MVQYNKTSIYNMHFGSITLFFRAKGYINNYALFLVKNTIIHFSCD